jgi:plasmid stabilization system protein ParE
MQTSFDIPATLADELSRAVRALKNALSSGNSDSRVTKSATLPPEFSASTSAATLAISLPATLADSIAHLDLALADLIENDATSFGTTSTSSATQRLTRYLEALQSVGIDSASIARCFPSTLEAAILAALSASANFCESADKQAALISANTSSMQDRAFALALDFPALRDDILAVALAFGIPEEAPTTLDVGSLVFGRWRIESLLGNGTTAQVALARDELLSTATASVQVVIKRFDDREGAARAHALRELRAIVSAPAGVAPQPLAMQAPPGAAAHLIVRAEPSRAASSADDIAAAAEALAQLHAAGIVHSDLKPAHIRVRPDGRVFFIDFGCATDATNATVRADFERLAEIARPIIPSIAGAAARTALARGRTTLARHALHAFAPRVLRRRTRKLAIALVIVGATSLSGLAFGRWLATPAWRATRTNQAALVGDRLGFLAQTGRLLGASIGPDGRLESITLDVPEGTIRYNPDGTPRLSERLKYFRLLPSGGVDYAYLDEIPERPERSPEPEGDQPTSPASPR